MLQGRGWFYQAGGVIANGPGPVSGRYLSLEEREEIALGLVAGDSIRQIAAGLGRSASTVSGEIKRNLCSNRVKSRYKATVADQLARQRAARPKTAKLAADQKLREYVQDKLVQRWSPMQISARLKRDFPDCPKMHVSHETSYQSLYVQGRGALRRELATCLRTGRALRKPRKHSAAHHDREHIHNKIMISDRPADVQEPGRSWSLGR
jgi:IS30 family transposase